MRRLSTHRGRLVYGIRDSAASRLCIVLLHGFASSSRAFEPAWSEAALDGCELLVPDLPGFGASPALAEEAILETSCSLLTELLAPIEKRLVLVGTGSGGNLAFDLAARLPQTWGLVSLDTPLRSLDAEELAEAALCDDIGAWLRERIRTLSAQQTPQARQQLGMLLQADPRSCRQLARELLVRLGGDEAARLAGLACRRAWWQSCASLEASREAAQERDIPTLEALPALDVEPAAFYAQLREFCAQE